jgi:prevent-host-death family protein
MVMKRIGIAEAKAHLSEVVRDAAASPIVIHNRGRDVAVVLSVEDYERLTKASAKSPAREFLDSVQELKDRYGGGADFPYERMSYTPRDPFAAKKKTR